MYLKNLTGILIGITLNLYVNLEVIGIFSIIESTNPQSWSVICLPIVWFLLSSLYNFQHVNYGYILLEFKYFILSNNKWHYILSITVYIFLATI